MKRLISISMAFVFGLATTTFAQPELRPEQMERNFKNQIEELAKTLSLTPDQVKKLEAINAETLKTLKVDIEKAKELKDKIKATQADRQTKIDNILTNEQQEKFKAVQDERQAERQNKMKEAREKRMKDRNKTEEKK
jgi:Spy/CpxP family protein refolding chaperone